MKLDKCPFCEMGQQKRIMIYLLTKEMSVKELQKLKRRINDMNNNKKYKENHVA